MQARAPFPQEEPVGGRYELLEPVGEGNFSVTHRARDLRLGRTVAVKILRPQYAADPSFVSRFEREAQVAASVTHPNVVDVYDFGRHGGTFFIAMQFVPGRTLKQALEAEGRFAAAEAVRAARQVLAGLSAIHAAGIVHRDIKPQNVLLGLDGVARVTDFGVAHGPLAGSLTTQGTTVGTASYMAPEQARGGPLSAATDLYAVGVVLFELLTGRLPFEADNPMAVMLAHLQQPAPRPSEVAPDAGIPPAVEAEVMRALAKEPGERHAAAEEMADALAAAVGERPDPSGWRTPPPAAATAQLPVADEPDDVRTHAMAVTPAFSPSRAVAERSAPPITPAPPPLLPTRRPRRNLGWLGPVAVFAAALAILVAVAASGGLPGGGEGGDGDDGREPLPAAAIDETATATAAATTRPLNTPVSIQGQILPTSTPPPDPTEPPEPTATPTEEAPTEEAPTETPEPMPTDTPEPPPTEEPTPAPTATPEPTAAVVQPDDQGGSSGPPIEPVEGTAEPVEGAQAGTIASFAASDWESAFDPGPTDWYGRDWVAIYGGNSAYPSASLSFTLDEVPAGGITFFVTGLDDDDTSSDTPVSLVVNGQVGSQMPSPFQDCVCSEVDRGANAPWTTVPIEIGASFLQVGTNTVGIVNLEPVANSAGPPYVLLADARVEANQESASVQLIAGDQDSEPNRDRGRRNRGRKNKD